MREKIFIKIILIAVIFISASCSEEKNLLPHQFEGLTLTKKTSGQEAKSLVDNMHLRNVAAKQNEIGFYKGKTGQATIYITYYDNKETAALDADRMTEKISPQNSVFIGNQHITINGKDVFRCFGMGQSHYVFSQGKELFWISVDTHIGKDFVSKYLNYLGVY